MSEENQYRPIHTWNEDDRPREKLQLKGKRSLSDAELIAIILGTGTRKESAVDLARKILNMADNNLVELGKLTLPQLQRIQGVGPVKAITLTAALELGSRRQESSPKTKKHVKTSQDIYDVFGPHLAYLNHEEFWVMCLNRNNSIIGTTRIGSGGISATVADIRLMLKFAIENHACSMILCHNHPSGNLQPSNADLKLTVAVKEAASWMDIALLDHIIVTDSAYYSFADQGKME